MSEKTCNTCELSKSLDEYCNNKRNKDGKDNRCKACESERRKQNIEKRREYQKKWREKNPDYMKNYEQKPELIAYRKEYYKQNSKIYKDRKKQWRKDNPEKEAETRQKYNEENRDKLNEYHRQWKQEKRDNDINYKLKENTSRRIRYELNTLLKGKKTKRTIEYIGCTIDELKLHIEKQFTQEMSWENYGSYWHIDHIIPCAAWDLIKEEDNKYCWNFRNLQPLESSENQSKKDKYEINDKEEYVKKLKLIFENKV
jgi:hypothetical protein